MKKTLTIISIFLSAFLHAQIPDTIIVKVDAGAAYDPTSINAAVAEKLNKTDSGTIYKSKYQFDTAQANNLAAIALRLNITNPTYTGVLTTPLTSGMIPYIGFDGQMKGSSTFVRDSATGNVSIGTATPANKLHVVNTNAGAETFPIMIQNSSGTIGTKTGIIFNPSPYTTRYSAIEGIQEDGNNSIGLGFITGMGATITEKMRITSSGNVGIGTTTPTQKLTIAGKANYTVHPSYGVADSFTMIDKKYADEADALKANDASVVHKAGVDTITGQKIITTSPQLFNIINGGDLESLLVLDQFSNSIRKVDQSKFVLKSSIVPDSMFFAANAQNIFEIHHDPVNNKDSFAISPQLPHKLLISDASGSASNAPTMRVLVQADAPWTTSLVASTDLAGQTSAGNIVTYVNGSSDASFEISGYINVIAITTDVLQFQVTYTDVSNTARTVTIGSNVSVIGDYSFSLKEVRVKSGTTITVKTNQQTGGGTETFYVGATIIKIR